MNTQELTELFKPVETSTPGRSQVNNQKISEAYDYLSEQIGLAKELFDTRACTEASATTRSQAESLGKRFSLAVSGTRVDEWVCFVRIGGDENARNSVAASLGEKFAGTTSVLALFAVEDNWEVFRIFYAKGRRALAEKIAGIFGVTADKLSEAGTFQIIEPSEKSALPSLQNASGRLCLPKPFILLAGISGTGKTRYVKRQANAGKLSDDSKNLCIVPVRPDWHDPSDLLGYVSRISGERYIPTEFLKFLVAAWVACTNEDGGLKPLPEIEPFWLCLDEMNLAPVEQYFADFLSVLESRTFDGAAYKCDPMLSEFTINALSEDARVRLIDELFPPDVDEEKRDKLVEKFRGPDHYGGIPIPPNLIVAGTVNMDETTHGFSRKVIDRAFTVDFQEFFPNDFQDFLPGSQPNPVTLSFPQASDAKDAWTVAALGRTADPDGTRSVLFLEELNSVLRDTPFELAYRALNELLLAVACLAQESAADPEGPAPETADVQSEGDSSGETLAEPDVDSPEEAQVDPADLRLMAVWDDFVMQKVLPRIEGDSAKLRGSLIDAATLPTEYGSGTVLHDLYAVLSDQLAPIWGVSDEDSYDARNAGGSRPDLLRALNGASVPCRSRKKVRWMLARLKTDHFTNFWV